MPFLQIIASDGSRLTRPLADQPRFTVGRSSKNDVVLSDLSLSRNHAELVADGENWVLRDCGSRNGTFLNGRMLEAPAVLRPGDRIGIGGCTLQFQLHPEPSENVHFSDEPMPAEGTVILPVNDVMTMSESPRPAGRPAADDGGTARLRKFQIIEQANMELLSHEPMDILLPKIMDLVARAVEPDRAALFLQEPDGELTCRAFRGGASSQEMSISRTIADTVLRQRVAVLTSDAQMDARFREGASIMAQGIRSVMAAPLWNNREVIGLIYADSRLASALFQDEDLRVLTMLANIAAIQIENARLFEERIEKERFEQEARAAGEIQRRLLPAAPPVIPGYLLAGFNTPCYEVGGDYFDYLPMADAHHAIVLADVAGKGMGAAMLMAGLQATCHARLDLPIEPADLLNHLNTAVLRTAPANRFVTLFLIDLDPRHHRMRFVNAGHSPAPILVRASGEAQPLKAGGVPLGILPKVSYPVGEAELGPGDFVFLCSDGVTETVNPAGDEYGEERLAAFLVSLAGRTPAEIRQAVEDDLGAHAQGAPQPDDLTMVIVQRTG